MAQALTGKVAVISGAAGGIGRAVARLFIAEGAQVMLADTDEAALKAEIDGAGGDTNARYFAGDLRERLTMANLLSGTIDEFGQVDVLVNCARRWALSDPLNEDGDGVRGMLDQNLITTLRLSQLMARRMIAQAASADDDQAIAGSIVNISSIAATHTRPDLMGYSISFAAQDQMTRSLAVALAPHRIRVNAVAPGSIMSASLRRALNDAPDLREQLEAATPMGRIADPAEVAQAALFLASAASGFVTGEVMKVDGGRTLMDPAVPSVH